jgi:hypothetical protein
MPETISKENKIFKNETSETKSLGSICFGPRSDEMGVFLIREDFVCCCVCEISENLWFLVSVSDFCQLNQSVKCVPKVRVLSETLPRVWELF